jgi:hypothetical protein
MLSGEKEILIEKLFTGNLSDAERNVFEKYLSEDADFREEVKAQRLLVQGINNHGRALMRAELAGIYAGVKPDIEQQNYKPKHSSSIIGKIIKWLVQLGIVSGAAFLLYQHRAAFHIPEDVNSVPVLTTDTVIRKERRVVHGTHIDTIWHTKHVRSATGKKGDTVGIEYGKPHIKEAQ